MATQKQYIGSGKASKYDGVIVTLLMADAMKHVRKDDKGNEWLTFIVDPRRTPDEKGRTHKAFVLTGERTPEPTEPAMASEPAPAPIGEVVKKGGRKLRRISAEEAAAKRAAFEDMAQA